jgi:short-chain Z-isoprenyl diphosphate synthase
MRNFLYRIYERSIRAELENSDLPKHVAVMLDGNRRWAERRPGAKAAHGHAAGAQKIQEFLGWCDEIGIGYITLYMLSTDNLQRRESQELAQLLKIIGEVASQLAQLKRWRLRLVGNPDLLPKELLTQLRRVEKATKSVSGPWVNLAIGYGGRQEIADAVRKILQNHSDQGASIEDLVAGLSEEHITEHLYTTGQPDPDLIIRTSGEQRLSGFLLWQSSNAELYFEEALWPDFRKVDFFRALRAYSRRHRRYGA